VTDSPWPSGTLKIGGAALLVALAALFGLRKLFRRS
jgi:MYXO-CTERM domain-containing protein